MASDSDHVCNNYFQESNHHRQEVKQGIPWNMTHIMVETSWSSLQPYKRCAVLYTYAEIQNVDVYCDWLCGLNAHLQC